MTKSELRRQYQDKRDALNVEERHRRSMALSDSFFHQFNFSGIRILHCYLPLERKHEIDTWLLIDRLSRELPKIQLVVPRINSLNDIESISFEGRSTLQPNDLGILEPISGQTVDPTAIDLVIVPLIVFDKRGHRVGYGKGFYDRFLSCCKSTCLRVGLSYFTPTDSIDDANDHDIPLTHGITPDQFYDFRQPAPAD